MWVRPSVAGPYVRLLNYDSLSICDQSEYSLMVSRDAQECKHLKMPQSFYVVLFGSYVDKVLFGPFCCLDVLFWCVRAQSHS